MATPYELGAATGGIAPGTLLGKYQVLKHLATGGMAEIFLARTLGVEGFERYVVVKCIKPAFATDPQFVQMFLDEARISAQLHHQHIAQVFDMGVEQDVLYFAMEYVHGQNVQSLMMAAQTQGRHIPYEHAIAIVLGAAAGLDYAHDRLGPDGVPLEIVHRDVTPTNILVSYEGAVKVVDFGIVKATTRATHTRSGVLKGKLQYMSPEQCKSKSIDRRSDVFALGILLYELTVLQHLYQGASDYETMDQIVRAAVTPPSTKRASYPAELEAIVLRCLAKDPAQRYATAAALAEDLLAFAQRAMMTPTALGLARFMRELFGKPGEPWLGVAMPPTPPFVISPSPVRALPPSPIRPVPSSGELLVPAAPPTLPAPVPARRRRFVPVIAAVSVLAIAAIAMVAISRGGETVRAAPAAVAPAPPVVQMPVTEPVKEPVAPTAPPTPAPAVAVEPPVPVSKPKPKPLPKPKRAPVVAPTPPAPTPVPVPETPKLRDGDRLRPPD